MGREWKGKERKKGKECGKLGCLDVEKLSRKCLTYKDPNSKCLMKS